MNSRKQANPCPPFLKLLRFIIAICTPFSFVDELICKRIAKTHSIRGSSIGSLRNVSIKEVNRNLIKEAHSKL
jgi:hypothetical protein